MFVVPDIFNVVAKLPLTVMVLAVLLAIPVPPYNGDITVAFHIPEVTLPDGSTLYKLIPLFWKSKYTLN
jgi:hypothetical protein